ncbi:MAG TPA: hypothetical protein VMV10_16420 [Pirellulales bacterium]|nr:hypothetical protein [Pirellulales bacterium]
MAQNNEQDAVFDLDHADLVAVRQAFYEGLGRSCLNAAWSDLNAVRSTTDEFLGRPLPKRGVSQLKIATAIDRSTGEICRWLQGQSPEWANLMVVMLVLDAAWDDLRELPAKMDRKRGGYQRALFYIRRHLLGDDSKELLPPTLVNLRSLEALFNHEQWAAARRIARRRSELLALVAAEQNIDPSVMDASDQTWGMAFSILQRTYLHSIDVAIWRSPAK